MKDGSRYLLDNLNWAEWGDDGPHLDPIGASDLLYDFSMFVQDMWVNCVRSQLELPEPADNWRGFRKTTVYAQYGFGEQV